MCWWVHAFACVKRTSVPVSALTYTHAAYVPPVSHPNRVPVCCAQSIQFQFRQLLWKLLLLARVASLPEAAARDMLHHLKNRQIIRTRFTHVHAIDVLAFTCDRKQRSSSTSFVDNDDPDGNLHNMPAATHGCSRLTA